MSPGADSIVRSSRDSTPNRPKDRLLRLRAGRVRRSFRRRVKQGLNFRDYKPETCCLFPLYTLEWGDDILITSYGMPLMRECEPDEGDEIYPFACVNPPEDRGISALVEQREELEYRLGHKRWNKVLDRLRSLGHDV